MIIIIIIIIYYSQMTLMFFEKRYVDTLHRDNIQVAHSTCAKNVFMLLQYIYLSYNNRLIIGGFVNNIS